MTRAEWQAAYNAANRDVIRAQRKAYREANKELIFAQKQAYRQRHAAALAAKNQRYRDGVKADPERYAKQQAKAALTVRCRKYGMTITEYTARMRAQDNACAACEISFVDLPARLICVDHDHRTGAVRAFLCNACNTSLGHLGEDPVRIRRLAAYIERFQNQ